jgi:hypothetical protein
LWNKPDLINAAVLPPPPAVQSIQTPDDAVAIDADDDDDDVLEEEISFDSAFRKTPIISAVSMAVYPSVIEKYASGSSRLLGKDPY